MTKLSILLGILGVIGTGLGIAILRKRESSLSPGRYWLIGLAALLPAWLISVLALLGNLTDRSSETPLPPSVLFSSSAALLGVIVTDWVVRRLHRKGPARSLWFYWLLGVIAFLPAWAIALYFHP